MNIKNKDLGKAIITVAKKVVYDSNQAYEKLTFVKYNGHVYLSKKDVPTNQTPTGSVDDEYWLDYEIKSYNATIGIAFTRSKEKPVAPTGGSYINPHPVEGQWKPAPYDGEFVLWYSIRRFNENEDIQDPAWSEPSLGGYDLDTLVNTLAEIIRIIIE